MEVRKRPINEKVYNEWQRFTAFAQSLDRQAVFVLVAAALLMTIQFSVGKRSVFRDNFSVYFADEWQGVLSWGWWFGMQGITGFIIPLAAMTLLFRRSLSEIGLGAGDWKFALTIALMYVPLAIAGTWILSDQAAFQASYPHYSPAALDWRFFVVYELLYLFYWIGWEYMWRGFVLFGTAPVFGIHAVFVQMLPFAMLHLEKPVVEAVLSVVGAVTLGALVWRCRSFWIAVPVHAIQMFSIDLWCSLRIRTGVSGIGPEAFARLVREVLGG